MRQKIKVVLIVNLLFFVLIGSLNDVKAVESQAADSPENDQSIIQTVGLLDLKLLSGTKMDATHSKLPDGRHKIILNYSGTGALNVKVLETTFMIFQLPPEIVSAISGDIVAKYDVPNISVLGLELGRNTENFEPVNIERGENKVILDFNSLLSVNVLSNSSIYRFSLEITMDHLPFPTSEAGQFTFYGEATKQPIDLSILSDTTPAKAMIPYINIAAPVVNPVYSNHTTVSGTGEPNKNVTIKINGVSYEGNTDGTGKFSVSDIPEQVAGTEISVFLSDENSYRSQSTIVTVKGILKFEHVPDTLAFKTTNISSIPTYIKREEWNWAIKVLDTRVEGSTWRLEAKATEPLTSKQDPSHKLSDALVYVDSNDIESSLNSGLSVEVYSGTTENETIKTVSWTENTGPLIKVKYPTEVHAETYTTTITWTLLDAP